MRTVHDLGYLAGQRVGQRGKIDPSRVGELAGKVARQALSKRTYLTEQARTDALSLYGRVWGSQVYEALLTLAEGDTAREGLLWRYYTALID